MRAVLVSARDKRDQSLAIWRELCQVCPHAYYNSPGWIETWIDCLPDGNEPWLLLWLHGERPVSACMITSTRRLRGGCVPSRVLNVYGSGDYDIDKIAPIYNAFLTPTQAQLDLVGLFRLVPLDWDEIVLPGLAPDGRPGSALGTLDPTWLLRDYDKPLYFVELSKFPPTHDGYLALLSQNARSQIRRALRLYANAGEVRVRSALTAEEALAMAEELYALCGQRKQAKQQLCSINPFFRKFHNRLIKKRFAEGEIQLLHISNPAGTIGYLYNHMYRGVAYSYQSGFKYEEDNRLKPGLASHVEGILHNARLGLTTYDFGAGDERYKKTLSTGRRHMEWVRLLRPSLKMRAFKILKRLLERARKH
jgi:CelD/BcsL family acetyltransferase involved in cellulose biosynthesis